MKSFITGSRAYGTPTADSDVDLVVVVNTTDIKLLWEFKQDEHRLMFGKLNLVCFNVDNPDDMCRFERWLAVHNDLVLRRPVTKEEAIAAFRAADAECPNYTGYIEKVSP